MSNKEVCIVCDEQGNLWQFYIRQDGAFVYRIMYNECKWTKESKLDSNVGDFCIEIDNEYNFHIIYITSKGEIKYCIYKDHQWAGKILYSFDSSKFYIRELGLILLNKEIHVTFILCKGGYTEKGKLVHYVWFGEEGRTSNVYTLEMLPSTNRHYTLEIASESFLHLFFLTKEESEAAVMNCGYINGTWSQPKKLYGITGENIEIFTLEKDNEFNILNISKEGSSIILEAAFIDYQGAIKSEVIYETKEEIKGANLFMNDKTLWAQWVEGENKIKYTFLNGKWKAPEILGEEIPNLQIYWYKKLNTSDSIMNIKMLFGTAYPNLQLYVPKCLDKKEDEALKQPLIEMDKELTSNEEVTYNIKLDRQEDNNLIRVLQKRIATLQMQLQLKERTIEEAIENSNKLAQQNRIIEEKSEFFIKLQQETKKGFDNAKLQLKEERKKVDNLRTELTVFDGELQIAKGKISTLITDNEILNKEISKLTHENEALKGTLKEERSKSIFAKLLKKSDS